jgi:hypothetical protein
MHRNYARAGPLLRSFSAREIRHASTASRVSIPVSVKCDFVAIEELMTYREYGPPIAEQQSHIINHLFD